MSYDLENKSVSYLKLDVSPDYYGDYKKVVMTKQGDVNTRYLRVEVYENGKPIDITKYSTTLNIRKPSGGTFVTHGDIQRDITTNGTYVYFKIFKEMLDEIGHVTCDVSLYQEGDNVNLKTDGGIDCASVSIDKETFISKVKNTGQYVFEYDESVWKLNNSEISLKDYGITIASSAKYFSEDKIIVVYNDYLLLTTESFFIVVNESIYDEDYKVPVDEEGKIVFADINANNVKAAINCMHTHNNKDILDNTTASYTTEDKESLDDTVRLTGDQEIGGNKTFKDTVSFSEVNGGCINFVNGFFINSTTQGTLIGSDASNSYIGLSTRKLILRGNQTRPSYSTSANSTGAELALKSDADAVQTNLNKLDSEAVKLAGEQTIAGKKTFSGDLVVGGNLIITGATTTVNSSTLQVKDKLIEVAHGNTTSLTTPAGIVAPKYNGTQDGALVFDNTGTAFVGDVVLNSNGDIDVENSDLQALATREDLTNGNLPQWDGTKETLVDSGTNVKTLNDSINVKMDKSGGTFTGAVRFPEADDGCINFTDKFFINSLSGGGTLIGADGTASYVGVKNRPIKLRGTGDNPLYNDLAIALIKNLPKKVSDLENDSNFISSVPDLNGYVPITRTINGKPLSSNITLNYSDVSALPTYTIGVYKNTEGTAPVAICTVDYSKCDSENSSFIKIGMVCSHGNALNYKFYQDVILSVNYTGAVVVDTYKYFGAEVTYNNVARQFGDIAYTIDETSKIVTFYALMGQYSTVYSQPYLNLNGRTNGVVTQLEGNGTVYSSGTLVWGNNGDFAKVGDLPTNYVTTDTSQTITATKVFTGNVRVGIATRLNSDPNGAMEFGRTDGTAGTPYIDFHANETETDYDARIIVSGGSGSSVGSANVNIICNELQINGKSLETILTEKLAHYVTSNTAQTITATKTFDTIYADNVVTNYLHIKA